MTEPTGPITFNSTKTKSEKQSKNSINIAIPALSLLLILAAIFFLFAGIGVRTYQVLVDSLPNIEQLTTIQPPTVSSVYDRHGELIHEFSLERRFWQPLDSFPQHLIDAVIAIEDRRFYEHWGVDLKRIIGASIQNLRRGGYSQGASTLTQQLARNVFLTHDKTLARKAREIMVAIYLEKYYTKDQIIELYLNMIYLGAGTYGVEAAAHRFFDKSASELSVSEAAILAGAIQRPEAFRPDRERNHPRLINRRNAVLSGMQTTGALSPEEAQKESEKPIISNPHISSPAVAPWFIEEVRRQMERRYGSNRLYNEGLQIYTTLDRAAQVDAEKHMQIHMDSIQRVTNRVFINENRAWEMINVPRDLLFSNFDSLYNKHRETFERLHDSTKLRELQTSVVAICNETGAIQVLIGSRDFSDSRFNRAFQGMRQPGSIIKPFVYAAAIDRGYTPITEVNDRPITLTDSRGNTWRPENYNRRFSGDLTLNDALKVSNNLVAIHVLLDIGAPAVVHLAQQMGLTGHLPAVPALAIGAGEATNLQLTTAYSAFAQLGMQAQPYLIDSVLDINGRVLERAQIERKEVIDPETAALTNEMLRSVMNGGTGSRARTWGFRRDCAGKTGTTNNYSDAWFIGHTPTHTCGVWVGTDQQRNMGRGMTGTYAALPLWTEVMKSIHKDIPVDSFPIHNNTETFSVCRQTHRIANRYCPSSYQILLSKKNLPESCEAHTLQVRRDTSNVIDFFGSSSRSSDTESTGSGSEPILF